MFLVGCTSIARRAHSVALVALLAALALAPSRDARAASLAAQPTSAQLAGTDTVYVGLTPGHVAADNPWSIWAGPSPTYGRATTGLGIWTWNNGPVGGDSLQGWLPIREVYTHSLGVVGPDAQRPEDCLDYGNQVNYKPRAGAARTRFGVVGVWHSDPGNGPRTTLPGFAPFPLPWTPIAGARSAWCGLRGHGDVTVTDAVTGAPFNEATSQYNARGRTASGVDDERFPGYGSQWDQMLYRDILPTAGQSLTISFDYRTRLAALRDTAGSTRAGWFHGDPLSVTTGNFISASAAGSFAPVDSFEVYVGAPVNDASCRYSDGFTRPVADPQRRWFSEVIRVFDVGATYYEIHSNSGNVGTNTTSANRTVVIPASTVNALLALPGVSGRVRLVFRVKTNRGFDDEHGDFDSGAMGAALIDNVTMRIGAGATVTIGDFESVGSIDNQVSTPATAAWKSTGKPPGLQPHLESLDNLAYADVVGPSDSPYRQCDIGGGVVSMGSHDEGEAAGSTTTAADRDRRDAIVSPTIVLRGPYSGPGGTNAHGLTLAQANPTDDYFVQYDVYDGLAALRFHGNSYRVGVQAYPITDMRGQPSWSRMRYTSYERATEVSTCLREQDAVRANSLLPPVFAVASPDSVRIAFQKVQQCYRFGLTLGCSAADGIYLDNVSLALVGGGAAALREDTCLTEGWRYLQQTTSTPQPRYEHAMASLDQRGTILLFGGDGDSGLLGDTWEWDGVRWWQNAPSTSPSARAEQTMAYDVWRDRAVLFGGRTSGGVSGETWEWSGTTWSLRSTSGPIARYGHGMAYDPEHKRTVIFGGFDGAGVLGDLWEWDGSTWLQRAVSPAPAPRRDALLVYDAAHGRMILLGGRDAGGAPLTDAWEWEGDEWTKLDSTLTGAPVNAAGGFGASCSQIVTLTGTNDDGLTHFWNGQRWDAKPISIGPREGAAMAYDDPHKRLIVFGGREPGGARFADTWGYCCDCDTEEMLADSIGTAINPLDIDLTEPITIEDHDEVVGFVDEIYGQEHDTSTDMWYPNDHCDRVLGGTIMPEDTTRDVLGDLAGLGIIGATEEEVADTLYAWAEMIANKVLDEDDDWENQPPVMAAYTPPTTPHQPPAGGCYVFGGRDLIFIHGLRTTPIVDRMFLLDFRALSDWNDPSSFPGSADNPQYYGDGYWKSGAEDYWRNHIERFLTSKGIKNRYLIVGWPATMRMKDGIKSVLTQIGDAMVFGTGVVDPSGANDVSDFGTPSFVIVSHSTGGLITDAAMHVAEHYPNLGATYIPKLCKGQVALQCAFTGSHLATAGVAAAYFVDQQFGWIEPSWLCPLVNTTFQLLGKHPPVQTCPLTGPQVMLHSVLVDLVPPVSQLKWGGRLDNSPIRTVTVAGGHPTYTRLVKQLLLRGFDDGVLNANSQNANNNLFVFGPAGYRRTGKLREVIDMGIPGVRRRGYFLDQVADNYPLNLFKVVGTGGTAFTSMTGMVQPVGRLFSRGSGLSPFARYGGTNAIHNHFSFMQAAADHYGSTPGWDDSFNGNDYKTSKPIFGGDEQRNYEETRVLTDDQIFLDVPNTVYPSDAAPLLRQGDQPRVVEILRGKKLKFTRRPRGGAKVKDSAWLWKRYYHVAEGYDTKLYGDYVYGSLLKSANPPVCDSIVPAPPDFKVASLDWLHDAFPSNETPGLPGSAAFDTAAAYVKTGRNTAQTTGNSLRMDVPGDSLVACACGDSLRMDLVFRILPGPGNYRASDPRSNPPTAGMALLQLPTNQAQLVTSGDASFWGQYLANPGAYGTPGGHLGGTRWDPNTWNSARCDTAERNFFPVASRGNLPELQSCLWSATYHEADPKFTTLGILKHTCFLADTNGAATSSNVTCNSVPGWLAAVPPSRTGYPGTPFTREHTKIIPDGLLTPGAHVQYFLRRSRLGSPATFALLPDTNVVDPQTGESGGACASTDPNPAARGGHRWQQFGVLPDRWKAPEFGGQGMACMLVVDLDDDHGDERDWVRVADQVGATAGPKFGAHTGWHTADLSSSPNDPTRFVRRHIGQPGTTWDLFSVRGVDDPNNGHAGALGGRLSSDGTGAAVGKRARIGPTPEMLRTYYRITWLMAGLSNDRVLGPDVNRGQDDVTLLSDFVTATAGTARPRGLFVQGDGIVASERTAGLNFPSHAGFLSTKLGVELRNASYAVVSGASPSCVELTTASPLDPAGGNYAIDFVSSGNLSVLQTSIPVPEAVSVGFYQDLGVNGPYVSSVYKPSNATRPWVALTNGWDFGQTRSAACTGPNGRAAFLDHAFDNLFGVVCNVAPGSVTDAPDPVPGRVIANAVRVWNTPRRSGRVIFRLALVRADDVQVSIYDVAGRRVKTFSPTHFPAGEHSLSWSGDSDHGAALARGIYFAKVEYRDQRFVAKRRTVLLN